MYNVFLFSLWILLPIGAANIAPILVAKIPGLKKFNYPVDGYKKIHNKRILGDHKTIRGFIGGIIVAIIVVLLQQALYKNSVFVRSFSEIDFSMIQGVLLGILCGFGSLGGDALKSFFKRQRNILPGESFFPFDQLDYVIGAILMISLYVHLSWMVIIFLLVEGIVLHIVVSYLGYLLHLKDAAI